MKRNLILAATLAAPLLSACGGGDDNPPPLVEDRLCPASLDYSTVFTGGAGSGELAKVQLDTTKMTWQVTYVESAVPLTAGTVVPTRAGTVDSGTLTQETLLPTNKLNQCAFRLNGASLDPTRPARIFVGEGVAGGTIPGKEIQFGGVLGQAAVPDTKFPYYPFIGFSSIETDLTKVAGTYSHVGFGEVPSQNFGPASIDAKVTINADGSWTKCDTTGQFAGGACTQQGTNFAPSADGSGAFQSNNYRSQLKPTLSSTPQGKGFMIVGKLRNQLVPILVRTGVANPNPTPDANGVPGLTADDESSISILAPQSTIAVGSQNGEYIGVDSQFDYRTTALTNNQATLLDPFNASQASLATALDLDYTQAVPGTVTTIHTGAGSTPTGKFIFTGGVFGFLDNAGSVPYFTIGAFVQ